MRTLSDVVVESDPVRLSCSHCGMVANVDPWLHTTRYGHVPTIRLRGVTFVHNGRGGFEEPDAKAGEQERRRQ